MNFFLLLSFESYILTCNCFDIYVDRQNTKLQLSNYLITIDYTVKQFLILYFFIF